MFMYPPLCSTSQPNTQLNKIQIGKSTTISISTHTQARARQEQKSNHNQQPPMVLVPINADEVDDDPNQMFFTTSDLVKTINGILKENEAEFNEARGGGGVANSSSSSSGCGGFELQRRLPNGTTRRADENDMALADFQSKLKQTADKIVELSPQDKITWAKEQRQYGNKLYSKKMYKEAMDVYLTCLVAIDLKNGGDKDESGKSENSTNSNSLVDDHNISNNDRKEWLKRIDNEIKLPVLLNLSACTLKLAMHRKTCSFCDMALEIKKSNGSNISMYAKVYFRRGKSRMLLGMYNHARADFNESLALLEGIENENNDNGDAVRRELLTLKRLEENAQKNKKRQKEAMKLVLGGNNNAGSNGIPKGINSYDNKDINDSCGTEEKSTLSTLSASKSKETKKVPGKLEQTHANRTNEIRGLYADIHAPSSSKTMKTREFSTLRAKPRKRSSRRSNNISTQEEMQVQSSLARNYFLWYLQMVECSLRKILCWLGDVDEEEDDATISDCARLKQL